MMGGSAIVGSSVIQNSKKIKYEFIRLKVSLSTICIRLTDAQCSLKEDGVRTRTGQESRTHVVTAIA